MGTSASIIYHDGLNTWATYVHSDGYLEGVGATLAQHYRCHEVIKPLVLGGAISDLTSISGYHATDATDEQIEANAELIKAHSWARPVSGITLYYHRDRGDRWSTSAYRTYNSIADAYAAQYSSHDYVYLWVDGHWHWANWKRLPKYERTGIYAQDATQYGIVLPDNLKEIYDQALLTDSRKG